MAKAQVKKKAAPAARRASRKAPSRVKTAARSAARKVKAARPARKAVKAVAKVVKAAKASKAVKAMKAVKAARPAKPAKPAKPAARPLKVMKKVTAALPSKPLAVPPPATRGPVARPAAEPVRKTRTRRPRPRVHSDGAPVANWLPQGEKPRPSSFIPAPPRAEAPSLIAAPPASSDRLIRPEDVTEFVTRTVPVRVDVEQGAGRVFISVNPEVVTLRPGEGIEWDFRYLGGADVLADELVIEFEKPSPFSHMLFRSRKPGPARPHRQLSGAAQKSAAGRRVQYVVRAMTPFKTELANAKLWLSVV